LLRLESQAVIAGARGIDQNDGFRMHYEFTTMALPEDSFVDAARGEVKAS